MVALALASYAVVTLGGVASWGALRRLGVGAGAAAAVSRVVAWTLAAYVAWLAGWAGVERWWWVGLVVLPALAWWGMRGWRQVRPRSLLVPEAIGALAFVVVALLRLPLLQVVGTEKPMDLAILSTLLRPGTIPPVDPWLAGESIAYYYWGFLPWVLPAKLLALTPDVAFNLIVPLLAAVTAQAGWALARALGASQRTAAASAFLVVLAGTPDGWRQLLAGTPLRALDLWGSSRQIAGTITEFPLFTFHLGDLHPHLLGLPLALVALFLAAGAWSRGRVAPVLALAALVYGAAAAANPWSALPLGLGVLLAAAGQESGWVGPGGEGRRLWLGVVAVGVLGWLAYAPFWLHYHPPWMGLGVVRGASRWDELALFIGAVLVPLLLVGWELAPRWGGLDAARRHAMRAGSLAAVALVGVATRSIGFALAIGLGTLLLLGVVRGGRRKARPAWALTLVALALLAGMETVFVRDPYGGELYRMNTVFKASHLAFALLAVLAPVHLGWLRRRRPALAVAAAALVLAAGLPHLAAVTLRAAEARPAGWGGLLWLSPGDRAAADWLRGVPPGASLVEAVGDAYSDAARMSAVSGVPAVLGWENHEAVWRGDAVRAELARRRALIEELYTAAGPEEARRSAVALGADFVVIGTLERGRYPSAGLAAVEAAGQVVFSSGGTTIVSIDER